MKKGVSEEDAKYLYDDCLKFYELSVASSEAASSQQIAITVAKKVIDSLVLSIETNQPKFNALNAVVVRSQAEAQVAQHKFEKFVFDSALSTILESVSKGLTLN